MMVAWTISGASGETDEQSIDANRHIYNVERKKNLVSWKELLSCFVFYCVGLYLFHVIFFSSMQTLANPAYFSWDQLIVAHTPNHFSAAAACELVIVVIICFFWVFVVLVSVQPCTSPLCLSTSLCLPLYLYAHCPPMYTFPLVGNRSDQVPGHRPSILSHKPDGDMSIRAQRSQYTFAGHVFNSGQSVFTTTHLCFPWTPPPLLKHCIVLKVFETKLNHWILSRFLIRIYQYWLSAIF